MNAGNIILVKPTGDFIMVSKGAIRDNSVDPFSLGIYVKILAFGETDWQLNIKGLASYLNLTEEKIRRAFRVLEAAGYLRRQRVRDEANRFVGWNYEIGCVPFPTFGDSRQWGNPDVGENRPSENRGVYNNTSTGYKDLKEEDKKVNISRFDFRSALLSLGVSVETADTWMEVRRRAKAVNSELAFKDLCTEIAKSGQPAEECIRIAAVNSWRGFKADYLRPRNIVASTPQTPRPRQQEGVFAAAERVIDEINRKYQNLQQYDEQ